MKNKFIQDLWDLWVERHKIHKALRLLNKQEWSIEFLTHLLVRASKVSGTPLEIRIIGPNNVAVEVKYSELKPEQYKDDDIMNHLDDEVKMRQFMEQIR
jgi:hypothetical protein